MIRQMAFDLPPQETWRREDFFVSPSNSLALATIDGWRDWPLGKLVLIGPRGSGKTHLAHLWAAETGARVLAARDLARQDLPGLAAVGAVAIEDAPDLAGDPAGEEALFHLHNMLAEAKGPLLVTAPDPVRDWGLRLPDLQSRMEAAHLARLEAPDDRLLAAVLVKLFADRQVTVPAALIPWIVARMERSLGAARRLVAALDALALAEGKPISRSLAARLLDSEDRE